MRHCTRPLFAATVRAARWLGTTAALVAAMLTAPTVLAAQAHDHGAHASAPPHDARLDLLLGGPHVILYHRGYLALGDAQVAELQQLRRVVCEAEIAYVEQSEPWRERLATLLDDSVSRAPRPAPNAPPPSTLHDAMVGLATAESQWLTALMRTRRDAIALLTATQRTALSALRDHWAREAMVMIEEATRPGQRGHPGTQLPIRVPGMVVGATTLLPYCEVLHGPSSHISIPPPR